MSRGIWRSWCSWASVPLLALAGCQGVLGPHGLPKDPLFLSRRPIDGKADHAAPVTLAAVEPAPPPAPLEIACRPTFAQRKEPELPDRVLLSGHPNLEGDLDRVWRPARSAPGILTNRPAPRELNLPEFKDR